jgi:acyl-CoA synthetase (AMP-forming)/AMP-acid ligase II
MLLGRMLKETRQRSPDRTTLWFDTRSWTYAQFDDATDRLAASLAAAGVGPGDRVALFLPNCPELLLGYMACFKLGAITVPLNYRYRHEEARYAIEHSGATTLLVHPSLAGEVEAPEALGIRRSYLTGGTARPPFRPFEDLLTPTAGMSPEPAFGEDQPAAILYTSGTTARPKGVTFTHRTFWHNCLIQVETFAFTAEDVHLVSTAACHAAALTGQFLPNLYAGGAVVLTHLPQPAEVVQAIETRRVTRTQMLPASLEDLVEHLENHPEPDLSSWRCCTAGGDVVPLDLHHRFHKAAGFELTELCGMTELLSYATNPPFGPKRPGSVGKPAAQTRMRLADAAGQDLPAGRPGEILVQSPAMMVGYWKDPEATAQALRGGWMHTGDLGRQDEDGWYWFVGRRKEIIIRGGSNISPLEVEEVIDTHPAVRLSCVVGLPDPHLGEVVVAFVALREDAADRPTPGELRQFVAGRLAAYKVPERMTILDDMPLSPTGKVDRRALHARAVAEQAGEAAR